MKLKFLIFKKTKMSVEIIKIGGEKVQHTVKIQNYKSHNLEVPIITKGILIAGSKVSFIISNGDTFARCLRIKLVSHNGGSFKCKVNIPLQNSKMISTYLTNYKLDIENKDPSYHNLPHDDLILNFEITPNDPIYISQNEIKNNDYSKLFDTNTFDFKLIVEDKEIEVHRTILMLESKVFMAMFSGNYEEKDKSELIINYFEYDTVYQCIVYLYINKFDPTQKRLVEIFKFSDLYELISLKNLCINIFIDKVSKGVSNDELKVLRELSSQYNIDELRYL